MIPLPIDYSKCPNCGKRGWYYVPGGDVIGTEGPAGEPVVTRGHSRCKYCPYAETDK